MLDDGREVLRSIVDCSALVAKVSEAGFDDVQLSQGEGAFRFPDFLVN